ncbi:MAG TPA: ABC transporter ATP-binding protein [Terriglobales bacterium]|nr:ABC transporter ATP-binding protein [Terriglobales bacterium]
MKGSVASGIIFKNVSKFYGEVLGVNRVNLAIPPGITSLVGPNGSGKTTLMNLLAGLVQPTRGEISVLGIPPGQPERLFRVVGYCTQFDSYPAGATGREFLLAFLALFGHSRAEAAGRAQAALERVKLAEAADRKIAAYSKGMRQRIRLAQALCHDPQVLILDEPLNGLDPLARAETIALFRALGAEGRYLVISSHVLHEVDAISDQVVMLSYGYVVAEGKIHGVREEMRDHPMRFQVRCSHPRELAAAFVREPHLLELRLLNPNDALLITTRDPAAFYLGLNRLAVSDAIPGLDIASVAPADDDAGSVYDYLVGHGEEAR